LDRSDRWKPENPNQRKALRQAVRREKIRERAKKLAKAQRRTISLEQAARQLGISRTSAYDYAKSGVIPTIKLGERRLLVPIAAFERLMKGTQAQDA
jgi:excisionase family DNA binding protein